MLNMIAYSFVVLPVFLALATSLLWYKLRRISLLISSIGFWSMVIGSFIDFFLRIHLNSHTDPTGLYSMPSYFDIYNNLRVLFVNLGIYIGSIAFLIFSIRISSNGKDGS